MSQSSEYKWSKKILGHHAVFTRVAVRKSDLRFLPDWTVCYCEIHIGENAKLSFQCEEVAGVPASCVKAERSAESIAKRILCGQQRQ